MTTRDTYRRTSNCGVAHVSRPADGQVNAIVNRLQAVARAATVIDGVVAERRPSVHSSEQVVRLRGDVGLLGAQLPIVCVRRERDIR